MPDAIVTPQRASLGFLFGQCNRELIAAAPEVQKLLDSSLTNPHVPGEFITSKIQRGISDFFSVWNLIREEMDSLDKKFASQRITTPTALKTLVRCSLVVLDLMAEDAQAMGMIPFTNILASYYDTLANLYHAEAGFIQRFPETEGD